MIQWEEFDAWYAEHGWKYVSSREGAFVVWKAAADTLRQRVAELEEVRDAALAEVALLKPNPLCDTGCMLSCKMEADYYEKQITALKSALREAMKEMLRCQYYEGQLDKAVAVIAAALGEEK